MQKIEGWKGVTRMFSTITIRRSHPPRARMGRKGFIAKKGKYDTLELE